MVEDTHEDGASPKNEPTLLDANEDAETRAARRELKQSSISDPPASTSDSAAASSDGKSSRPDTPLDGSADAQQGDETTHVSSPKKKRAHDQLDKDQDVDENDATSVASADSTKDRALRLEPEKKRARDQESQGDSANTPSSFAEATTIAAKTPNAKLPQTSQSAFAASGFGKLATVSSPFASLAGPPTSVFGLSGSSSPSPFGAVTAAAPPKPSTATIAPQLTFGSANSASPFAGLSTVANGFGGHAGSTVFGGGLSGAKELQTFASSAGKPAQSKKPAKPFGAPESDGEDNEDDSDAGDNDELAEAEGTLSPERDSEEKRRLRLQKVQVDDGEAGEVTIASVRAKMFHHDKEAGWKERGAGMLKINAPVSCVEFDDSGIPIPGSFDASGLDISEDPETAGPGHKVARLIMRQDQTHRVILNTAILPTMKFQEKASLKSVGVLFTAFEGEEAKPVSVTMKMSAANSRIFLNEIGIIQKELQGN